MKNLMLQNSPGIFLWGLVIIMFMYGCETDRNTPDPQDTETPTPAPADFPTETGDPVDAPIIQTIGTEGGEIRMPDGKTIFNFPAGAFSKSTKISIQPVKSKVPGAFDSTAFVIGPENLEPLRPVTISRVYTQEELAGTALEVIGMSYQDKKGVWQGSTSIQRDRTTNRITASIPKFAHPIAWYEQFYMVPATGTLSTNQSTKILIWFTQGRKEGDIDSYLPVGEPTPADHVLERDQVRNWRVNGVLQGQPGQNHNAASGYFNPEAKGAVGTYYPPKSVPPAGLNPVAISTELNLKSKEMIMLVSNFQIVAEAEMTINGVKYENVEATASYSIETGGFSIVLSQQHDPEATAYPSLSVIIKSGVTGKGTFAIQEDQNVIMSATDSREPDKKGSPWASSYLPYFPDDMVYGPGTIEITHFNSQHITGKVSATLHNSDSKDHRPITVSAKFHTARPSGI